QTGQLTRIKMRKNVIYVIDTVAVKNVDNDFQNRLANVARGHRRQWQTNVINRNCHLHSRLKLGEKRITAERMIERVANRRLAIWQTLDRRVGIKDARTDRQVFENEVFA